MNKIIRILIGQGIPNAPEIYKAMVLSGIATEKATHRNVTAMIVAVSAPPFTDLQNYVLDRLAAENEEGETFGEVLKMILEAEPARLKVSQLSINTSRAWCRINTLDGHVLEFEKAGCRPAAFRNDAIFSGGLIAALSLALQPEKKTDWIQP